MPYSYNQLSVTDVQKFRELILLFSVVFEDQQSYRTDLVTEEYLAAFLSDSSHIVLVAQDDNSNVIGGLVAYELQKFEQQRKEIFVYDLAVSKEHHRKGGGTALFEKLKVIARERGTYIIFVEADKSDDGAVSFYRTIKSSEVESYTFDIEL